MMGKKIAASAVAMTLVLMTANAHAAGAGGMMGGGAMTGSMNGAMGAANMMNRARVSNRPFRRDFGTVGGSGMGKDLQAITFPTNDTTHYYEVRLVGRFAPDESGLTIDRQIVRMTVDGRSIPMSIDGDETSADFQLDQGDEAGQDLYRLILSKQMQVVGDKKLRSEIADAAKASPAKQVVVDAFVHDRVTPYLVLVSVSDAP